MVFPIWIGGDPGAAFSGRELAGLEYAGRLTTTAAALGAADIDEPFPRSSWKPPGSPA